MGAPILASGRVSLSTGQTGARGRSLSARRSCLRTDVRRRVSRPGAPQGGCRQGVIACSSPAPWQPPGLRTEVRIAERQSSTPTTSGQLLFQYHQLEVPMTANGIALIDITPQIRELVSKTGLQEGAVNVLSRHTTTALTINENESRLLDDVRQFLTRLAPPTDPYLHNDLHLRPAPEDWPGGWAAWAPQEPRNAHSHLLSMLLGNTLTVPVSGGKLALGTWQSVLLVELDGPRPRTVGVQLTGYTA